MKTCGFKTLAYIFFAVSAVQAHADWNLFGQVENNSQFESNASGPIYVDSDNLSFQSAPFSDGSTVFSQKYKRSTKLNVIRHDGSWYFVSDGQGHQGWVSARKVSTHAPAKDLSAKVGSTFSGAPAAPAAKPSEPAQSSGEAKDAKVDAKPAPAAPAAQLLDANVKSPEAPKAETKAVVPTAQAAKADDKAAAAPAADPNAPPPNTRNGKAPSDVNAKEEVKDQVVPPATAAPAPTDQTKVANKDQAAKSETAKAETAKTETATAATPAKVDTPAKADGCLTSIPGKKGSDNDKAILASIRDVLSGPLTNAQFKLSSNSQLRKGNIDVDVSVTRTKEGRISLNVTGSVKIPVPPFKVEKKGPPVVTKLCVSKGVITATPVGANDAQGKETKLTLTKTKKGRAINVNGNLADYGAINEVFVRQ